MVRMMAHEGACSYVLRQPLELGVRLETNSLESLTGGSGVMVLVILFPSSPGPTG